MREAFGHDSSALGLLILGVCFSLAMFIAVVFFPAVRVILLAIEATCLALVAFAGLSLWNSFLRERHSRDWLASLPYEFDRDAYLKLLCRDGQTAVLRLTVRFASGVVPNAQKEISDAVLGLTQGVAHSWVGAGELALRSPQLSTGSSGGGEPRCSSAPIHRWFFGLVEHCVRVLDTREPIVGLELRRFEGAGAFKWTEPKG